MSSFSIPVRSLILASALALTAVPSPGEQAPPVSEPAGPACRHPWLTPVEAPVVDPFRPPSGRYGPGNRGIEYGAEPGQPVVAVDDGVVTFAGPVAGNPVVVVSHGGGLRSSFVHLLEATVEVDQRVTRGQGLGLADAGFHLGARLGAAYVDPAELLDRRCVVVRLVPV